jgi:hypothetical protein
MRGSVISRNFLLALLACPSSLLAQSGPASQRELNGFLLGQYKNAITASFDTILRVDTTPDGWVSKAFLLDRAHHSYMAFGFRPEAPDYAVSIQVTGDSGTPMRPFVGLALGSPRDSLLARLGPPSSVVHQDDVETDLYIYDGRNYSIEVNKQNRVASIQVMGYEGFPDSTPSEPPSLDSLLAGLRAGGDAALQYLMPDVEISYGERVLMFRRSAYMELVPDTSQVAVALFRGPRSLVAALQDSVAISSADVNLRIWEKGGMGWVWKFPPPAQLAELVFKANAGRWRVWEASFR